MNELIYSFRNNNVRIVEEEGQVWFNVKDVCEVLELSNPSMVINRLEEDERAKFNLGRQGEANFVNEYGIYNLIFGSRKQEAKEFKRWVTHEVLPSIRKNGLYATGNAVEKILENPYYAIELLQAIKKEREDKQYLEDKIRIEKPKVLFAEAVSEAKNTISVNELCKLITQNGYTIGSVNMFKWLRNKGYLMSTKGSWNLPKQKYVEQGLFKLKQSVVLDNGNTFTTISVRITGKGQQYFIDKFLSLVGEENV